MSIDLTTSYGGLNLRSPVVVGACPMTAEEMTRVAIDSSGAGAIVLPSLLEEQVMEMMQFYRHDLTDCLARNGHQIERYSLDGARRHHACALSQYSKA